MALSVSRGESYWLLSSSGQVFAYGKARNYGSESGKNFRGTMVGIVSAPNGKGYWLVSSIGRRFSFGDAHLYKYKTTELQNLTGHVAVRKLRGRIVGVAIAKLTVAKPATATTPSTTPTTTAPVETTPVAPVTTPATPPTTTTTTSTSLTPTTTTDTSTTSTTQAEPVPAASSAPTIAATGITVGDELTASTDTWSNDPTGFTYEWDDCEGSDCAPVATDGTSQTYTLTASDVGDTIELVETATNGTGTSEASTSVATAVITEAPSPQALSPAINPTSLSSVAENISYSATLTATGGDAPYFWEISAGTLPPGLSLDSASGSIAGIPTVTGSYPIAVTVTGADGGTATSNYTLAVTPPISPTITTTTVPYPIENIAFSTALTATGGYPPYTWALASGSTLPAGLTLDSAGTLSGTASVAGEYTFTATVTGADQGTASITYLLMVANPSDSYNWSGYVQQTTGVFTSVSGTFTIPALTPGDSTSNQLAEWVGIDGWSNSDLIQAGIDEQPGMAPYAWWEILPDAETRLSETVETGDQINVNVAESAPATACSSTLEGDPVTSGFDWTVTITDNTQGWSYPQPLCYDGPGESAEWIAEAPEESESHNRAEIVPLAPFSPNIAFTDLATSTSASALDYTTLEQQPGTAIQCDPSTGQCTAPTDPAQVATPSLFDANGFSVAYGATAPAAP